MQRCALLLAHRRDRRRVDQKRRHRRRHHARARHQVRVGALVAASHTRRKGRHSAPTDVTPPAVAGQAILGRVLTTSTGTWSNTPTSFSYQWEDCNNSQSGCTAVSGATSGSYTLSRRDVGHVVRSVVTATNAHGSGQATSNATSPVGTSPRLPR